MAFRVMKVFHHIGIYVIIISSGMSYRKKKNIFSALYFHQSTLIVLIILPLLGIFFIVQYLLVLGVCILRFVVHHEYIIYKVEAI